ncbi:hypothetical protein, partial [Escherichia coli]|uniref:hypothetical protein n=1 Tax=Escherichia coli TaxID=562 RepID=UPI0019D4B1FB
GKSSLRPLMAGSSASWTDGAKPADGIVQSASDVQCSRLLKTTFEPGTFPFWLGVKQWSFSLYPK